MDCLGDGRTARQFCPLAWSNRAISRPAAGTVLATTLQAWIGGKSVDLKLDVEQRIDPFDGLQRSRRDRRGAAAAFGIRGDVGQHEELAPRARPAERLRQRPRIAVYLEQRIVAPIGISLQNAGKVFKWRSGCSCRRSREA